MEHTCQAGVVEWHMTGEGAASLTQINMTRRPLRLQTPHGRRHEPLPSKNSEQHPSTEGTIRWTTVFNVRPTRP